ncbi:MAG: endo alpha-1,4 polygalactosaminidase [Actinomycetota bacterium]|nr:endo alpha-1,4 polygalactosaminidase [Actinomycetota bacterium]
MGSVPGPQRRAPPGDPVVDGQWGEFLLDTGRAGKRAALADIVGEWIDGCAADGFDAVEFDNLDSWDRGQGLISKADNKAFARLLTARAHAAGLAAAQKNWADLSPRGPQIGFDLAVAEECGRWGPRLSIVRRDLAVTPAGVNRRC